MQKKWHGATDDWLKRPRPRNRWASGEAGAARGLITYMISPQAGVMTGSLVDYDQNIAGWSASRGDKRFGFDYMSRNDQPDRHVLVL